MHCVHGTAPLRLIAKSAAVSLLGVVTSKYINTALPNEQCHIAVVACWLAQSVGQAGLPPQQHGLGSQPTQAT